MAAPKRRHADPLLVGKRRLGVLRPQRTAGPGHGGRRGFSGWWAFTAEASGATVQAANPPFVGWVDGFFEGGTTRDITLRMRLIYNGLGASQDFEAGFSLPRQGLQGMVLGLAMVSGGEAQIDEHGGVNFSFQAQVTGTNLLPGRVHWLWLRKNGTGITGGATGDQENHRRYPEPEPKPAF